MLKRVLFWIIAFVVTVAASVYQRITGPTNPKRFSVEIAGEEYKLSFPRSGGEVDCPVVIEGMPSDVEADIFWRKYPSDEPFEKLEMVSVEAGLTAAIPAQSAAGKVEYYAVIDGVEYFAEDPLVMRFKGDVSTGVLVSHIIAMFMAMLVGCYALLLAIANEPQYKKYIIITTVLLVIGGFIFGPIVQKHAFGMYWSGFPYGSDLTDNKTLIALIALIASLCTQKKRWNRWVAIASIFVLFAIFSIPHSLRGSELDHSTGEVVSSEE